MIWNNWGGDDREEQHEVVVVAPTGRPDGFEYVEGSDFLRQTLFLGAGVGCSDYMVDSQRIFVEVYGNAVQDAVELNTFFAGIILRDREDAKGPPIPNSHRSRTSTAARSTTSPTRRSGTPSASRSPKR